MAIRVVKMPDIGEGIAEVELVAWHVAVGDAVAEDQTLADVMTDKASVEIPSPVNGTVVALGGEVGQMMAVGSELIRIEATGDGAPGQAPTRAEPVEALPRHAPPSAPVRAEPAQAAPEAAVREEHVEARPAATPSERPIASPSVRRRAWELGVDLKDVRPSGPGGRILHADLDAAAARRPASTPTARAPAAATGSDEVQAVRVIGLRRKIAQRMQEAKRRIPHFT
ncbi:MAG TPA: biotin/lipoyl-containing protein, partial [Ideonella sp.]|nr:biotin/lipoyl-containing protein [Ideonella sp.]